MNVLLDSITMRVLKIADNAERTASNARMIHHAISVKQEPCRSTTTIPVTLNAELDFTTLGTTVQSGTKLPTAERAIQNALSASGPVLKTVLNVLLDFTLSLTIFMTCSRRVLAMTSLPLPNRKEDVSTNAELDQVQ